MSKQIYITALSALAAGLMAATPAQAQLGSVTGTVDGTVNGSLGGTVNGTARSQSRIGVGLPDTPSARVNAPTRAKIRAGSSGPAYYHGGHYHGAYFHDHGHYGYDHFHSDSHSHSHGYAKVVVKVDAKADAKADQPIGPLLAYGTEVRSKKGKNLGGISAMMRTETGMVTHILTPKVDKPIPIETLRADGNVLFTSLKKKKLMD